MHLALPRILAASAVLMAIASLQAQTSAQQPAPRATLPFSAGQLQPAATLFAMPSHVRMVRSLVESCPVGFYAGHSTGLIALRAGEGKPGEVSQSLNLGMSNDGTRAIVSAQITVHGLLPKGRVAPAVAEGPQSGVTSRQVAVKLAVDAGENASTDVRVEGFTSIQTIDLDSIAYADGSTWKASPQRPCSIAPNGFMRVASR